MHSSHEGVRSHQTGNLHARPRSTSVETARPHIFSDSMPKPIKISLAILTPIGILALWVGYIYMTQLRVFDDVDVEEISFTSGSAQLVGEVARPRGVSNPPIMVFAHGSGAVPAADLTWYARKANKHGYATLAFDKRGVGRSGGDPDFHQYFSFDTLAADVLAGVHAMRALPGLDTTRVYLAGVSQGGWVAPLAAAQSDGLVDGMMLISANATSVADDRIFERAKRLEREGFSPEHVAEATRMQRVDQAYSLDSTTFPAFQQMWNDFEDAPWFRRAYLGDEPMTFEDPWRRQHASIIGYTPLPHLAELDIPVVWVFGDATLDHFGPVAQSIENVRTLQQSGKLHRVLAYDGYDHNLEHKILGGLVPTYADWEDEAFGYLASISQE